MAQHQSSVPVHLHLPAVLHEGGAVRFKDQRRPGKAHSAMKTGAVENSHLCPPAPRPHPRRFFRDRFSRNSRPRRFLPRRFLPRRDDHPYRLHLHRSSFGPVSVNLLVTADECFGQRYSPPALHGQRRILTGKAQIDQTSADDRFFCGNTFLNQLLSRFFRQLFEPLFEPLFHLIQAHQHLAFGKALDNRVPQPQGAQ